MPTPKNPIRTPYNPVRIHKCIDVLLAVIIVEEMEYIQIQYPGNPDNPSDIYTIELTVDMNGNAQLKYDNVNIIENAKPFRSVTDDTDLWTQHSIALCNDCLDKADLRKKPVDKYNMCADCTTRPIMSEPPTGDRDYIEGCPDCDEEKKHD